MQSATLFSSVTLHFIHSVFNSRTLPLHRWGLSSDICRKWVLDTTMSCFRESPHVGSGVIAWNVTCWLCNENVVGAGCCDFACISMGCPYDVVVPPLQCLHLRKDPSRWFGCVFCPPVQCQINTCPHQIFGCSDDVYPYSWIVPVIASRNHVNVSLNVKSNLMDWLSLKQCFSITGCCLQSQSYIPEVAVHL